MNIKEKAKSIAYKYHMMDSIRKTFLYALYGRYNLVKDYKTNNHAGWIKALFRVRKYPLDYQLLLRKAKISNQGTGNFYYTIDEGIVVKTKGQIIGNIPVDYSYILNHEISDSELYPAISRYIKKIDNPKIKLSKPETLQEALQAILFWNSLLWQSGHKLMGLGRLDKVLEKYTVPENAEDLIKEFLLTLHSNYGFKSNVLRGDTGQIILVGGKEEDGSYFCNEYTHLFMKCIKELSLPDPKLLLRCSGNMELSLIEEAVDLISTGIGSPLISNDDVIIPLLMDFGYDREDAYNYGVSACWEPLVIGRSLEQNNLANINYGKCVNNMMSDPRFPECPSFEKVLSLYIEFLRKDIEEIISCLDEIVWERDPLLTLLMGLKEDISKGGAKYNNYGILSVGMSSAVNSLLNIQEYVFIKQKYSLSMIQEMIIRNYPDGTKEFSINEEGFGTNTEKAVLLTNWLMKKTEAMISGYHNRYGGKVKFGLSSPAYLTVAKDVGATLDGRKAGQPFATHISRDKGGPVTEIIEFASGLSYSGLSSNANVADIMIQKDLICDNTRKFAGFLMAGIKMGIFQMQFNVLSYSQLMDAKKHPEKYPDLIVRVWGFSAYFRDLPDEYQDHIIKRAREMEKVS